ncbi:MAG: sialate O-acetylesterase [Bacteroidota bacterium]
MQIPKFFFISLLILTCMIVNKSYSQNIKLASVFTDNMVLQRDRAIPVWGTAAPNSKLTIELDKQRITTVVDLGGNWRVDLESMKAGGPFVLKVSGKDTVKLKNVLIGDVWICSGQSNMAMSIEDIGNSFDNDSEIKDAGNFPNIRLLTVEPMTSATPKKEFTTSGWMICDENTIKKFSAAAYFFGKKINKETNVPIGLINSSYGGTDIEAWTSKTSLCNVPAYHDVLESIDKFISNDPSFLKDYNDKRDSWKTSSIYTDPGYPKDGLSYKDVEYDASSWKKMSVPCLWHQEELTEFNGSVWYRKEIEVPANWKIEDLVLNMGPIDDIDITWFNGVQLGSNELWDKPRQYVVPSQLVKHGKNVLVIRCIDTGGPGGVWGEADQYYISNSANETIPIAGEWSYEKTLSIDKFPPKPLSVEDPNCPTVLFNAMIAPVIPFCIRGVIWYQGENNTYNALQYRTLFPLLINDWRMQWQQGDFPFYFVQLANFLEVSQQPVEDTWAELREAQMKTLAVKNTGMAVAIDIGDAGDIHPKNKREVGNRLALIALNKLFGFKNEYSGPIYKSYSAERNKIRITFDYAEKGLTTKNDEMLKGFAIAGDDGKFVWADALIDGETVIVSSSEVPRPAAVRYAWSINPVCNLYNSAGLPASPFRTDDWPVLTSDFEK